MLSIKFCVGPKGKLPTRATERSAGFDLYATGEKFSTSPLHNQREGTTEERLYISYPENGVHLLKTDVRVIIPEGYYGKIEARSGLARTYGLSILGGVIDSDYRGEIGIMFSLKSPMYLEKNERIAQLLIIPIFSGVVQEVTPEEFEKEKTERGEGGFGSTGKT